jgi:hypothetical protein
MVQIQQHILVLVLLSPLTLAAQKFFPDDPLTREPEPLPVSKAVKRDINEYYDFFQDTLFEPGKDLRKAQPDPSAGINTLGEVPDNAWFTNRISSRPMSREELARGPGDSSARPRPMAHGK